jgi:hypothetical protein
MLAVAIRQRTLDDARKTYFAGRAFQLSVLLDQIGGTFRAKHLVTNKAKLN